MSREPTLVSLSCLAMLTSRSATYSGCAANPMLSSRTLAFNTASTSSIFKPRPFVIYHLLQLQLFRSRYTLSQATGTRSSYTGLELHRKIDDIDKNEPLVWIQTQRFAARVLVF